MKSCDTLFEMCMVMRILSVKTKREIKRYRPVANIDTSYIPASNAFYSFSAKS